MSMAENQSIISKVAKKWREYRRQAAIARRRARVDHDRAVSELELLIDDVRQEGYDPESEVGRQMVVELIRARIPSEVPVEFTDSEGFPK